VTIQVPSFNSRRSPVYSRYGMIGASQPLAAAAGVKILEQGGNAADAAVATAAALNVTEPGSTGLGGDCFALFYDARTQQVSALNGSGRAPQALTLEKIHQAGFEDHLPTRHPFTVTVPGTCAGWCDMVEKFGRLPIARVLAPAIRLAEEGFPAAPLTALAWQEAAEQVLNQSPNGHELTIDGRGPRPGEIFRNPGLGRAMRLIAEGGKKAFYEGPAGEAIVAIIQETGGCMELSDLAAHYSTWDEALSVTYRGLRIWECPPNGQGMTALMALNLLEGFDLASLARLSVQRLHLEIEAMRLAFADTRHYLADPAFSKVPVQGMLDKQYAAERRKLIDPRRANAHLQHGAPGGSSDTVYLSAVDGEGNACSFINSNYMNFGSSIVPKGWGFVLQNRGLNFSLEAHSPNVVAPGKRPYHTIIPAMATYADTGALYASFGVMGGFMQPQGHTQVAIAMVDDGLDPQSALDLPRFCIDAENLRGPTALEEGIPLSVMAALAEMGHAVQPVSGWGRSLFGRGQVIRRDPASGVLCGGSDPRADGCVIPLG
jgi:gamma-glutamyltranspeptidase / glutathione hydrolase